MSDRDDLSALCKDALYAARDNGGTMHSAADDAADAILAAGWRPPAPLTDPSVTARAPRHTGAIDTEVAAADLVTPRAGTLREKVLEALLAHPDGLTDRELAHATRTYLYSIAPRRTELLHGGWVVDSGKRRASGSTRTGAQAAVWVLSPAALARLEGSRG